MIIGTRGGPLVLGAMLLIAGVAFAQSEPELHCAGDGVCFCPNGSRPSVGCDGNCEDACGLSGGGGGGGNSDYDYEAERRAQEAAAAADAAAAEAAAEAERARQAEIERQRRETEAVRIQEEALRRIRWASAHDAAVARLRPSTGIVITPNAGGGTVSGGSPGSNAAPRSSGLPGGVSAAGSQAKSAATHGQISREVNGESSHAQASTVFDTAGQQSGTLVHPDPNAWAMPAFAATLPEPAKKDPQVQAELQHYQKTHALKEDTARKIDAVKAQQQLVVGDPIKLTPLTAQLGTLMNLLHGYNQDEAKIKQGIQTRVQGLGLEWKVR
jgi:hypothetical protein